MAARPGCAATVEARPGAGIERAQSSLGPVCRLSSRVRPGRAFVFDTGIESFETVILDPHGGDLAGFVLVPGTREQLDEPTAGEEFRRRLTRGALALERVGAVRVTLGGSLQQLSAGGRRLDMKRRRSVHA